MSYACNWKLHVITCLSTVMQREKQSLSDLNQALQEKDDMISKLEEDLRESQKLCEKGRKVQPYLK